MKVISLALLTIGYLALGTATGNTQTSPTVEDKNPTNEMNVSTAETKDPPRFDPNTSYFCHNGKKKNDQACALYNTQIRGARFTGCEKISGSWLCVSNPEKPLLTVRKQ